MFSPSNVGTGKTQIHISVFCVLMGGCQKRKKYLMLNGSLCSRVVTVVWYIIIVSTFVHDCINSCFGRTLVKRQLMSKSFTFLILHQILRKIYKNVLTMFSSLTLSSTTMPWSITCYVPRGLPSSQRFRIVQNRKITDCKQVSKDTIGYIKKYIFKTEISIICICSRLKKCCVYIMYMFSHFTYHIIELLY